MANALSQTIDQISKEKGIDPRIIHEALEDAMVAAARKFFKTEEDLQASFDPETGMIEIYAVKEVVEEVEDPETQMALSEALEVDDTFEVGDFIELPKPTMGLGRIAAQTAKQVIVQKVREAEREIVFGEFSDEIGKVVNGIVRRYEGRDVVLDIGRTEAILPFSEQSRNEEYRLGDRIRAVIIVVHRLSKGPQIVVSRTDPSLLIRLFEQEIPEVYDGTVVIKNAVREGGERAKVAVASREATVDPVGACVGMKGSRINAVIRELRGEKIDIIAYSDDIVEYTINALNPARISRVLIADHEARVLEVIVPEDQLSLAIGRKGQNVRLASRLLGWEIEIKSEEEKKQEILSQIDGLSPAESAGDPLSSLPGVGEATVERLAQAGIETVQALAETSTDDLTQVPGIGPKTAEKLLAAAGEFLAADGAQSSESSPEEGEAPEVETTEAATEVSPTSTAPSEDAGPEAEADQMAGEEETEAEAAANHTQPESESAPDQESETGASEETDVHEAAESSEPEAASADSGENQNVEAEVAKD